MPDFLADRFADWMGWGPSPNNRGEGVTPEGHATGPGGAGWARGKPKIDILGSDTTGLRRRHPDLEDDAGAGEPEGSWNAYSGEPLPYRKLTPASGPGVSPPMSRPLIQPQPATPGGPMPPLNGPTQRVAPLGLPPDMPMAAPGIPAPRRLPSAPQPMPQAGGGGQPQPLLPSGHDQPARPNFLGRARDWLGGEAFPAGEGMSRGMVLAQALGNFGAGLSRTGRVGTGLEMANKGMWDAREGEAKRQDQQLERAYKLKKLTQEAAPKTHVIPAGGILAGPTGEVLAQAPRAEKAATSIEAALLSDQPEVRARAEELRDKAAALKGEPTPYQRQQLELSRKRLDVEIAKANRPGGSPSAPAPTNIEKLIKFRQSLPPGDPNIPAVEAAIKKESSFAPSSSGGGTTADGAPKPKPLSSEYVGKNEAVKSGVEAAKRVRDYYFPGGKFSRWEAGKASIPGTGGAMSGTMGVGAAGDIDSAIDAIVRVRTGAAANEQELALYRRIYMPNASDPEEVAKAKLDKLDADLAGVAGGFREAQGLEREPAPATATDIPPPADGMSLPDYARLLHRNGMTVEQAKAAAEAAFKDQK